MQIQEKKGSKAVTWPKPFKGCHIWAQHSNCVLFQKSWENHLFYCQDFINVLKLNFFTFLDFILQQREFLEQLISQIKIDDMCINRLQDFGRKPFYQIRMKIYFNSFALVLFLKWKKWRILFFFVLGFPEFPWQNKIFENIFLLRCFISKCAQLVTTVSGLEHNTVLNFLPLK